MLHPPTDDFTRHSERTSGPARAAAAARIRAQKAEARAAFVAQLRRDAGMDDADDLAHAEQGDAPDAGPATETDPTEQADMTDFEDPRAPDDIAQPSATPDATADLPGDEPADLPSVAPANAPLDVAARAPALSWGGLRQIAFDKGHDTEAAHHLDIAGDPRVIRVIDDLRTQLLRTLQAEGWDRIAITGPSSGCGATSTAVNLALSISRIPDTRTILMDLNQRTPGVAAKLGLQGSAEIHRMLSGDVPVADHLLRLSDTLAVGLNTARAENASELLHSRRAARILDGMINSLNPDIVLYDLPAMLEHDDLSAFLPQVDGVLLVADAGQTLGRQIEDCERRLRGKTNLLGVILNRARRVPDTEMAA